MGGGSACPSCGWAGHCMGGGNCPTSGGGCTTGTRTRGIGPLVNGLGGTVATDPFTWAPFGRVGGPLANNVMRLDLLTCWVASC